MNSEPTPNGMKYIARPSASPSPLAPFEVVTITHNHAGALPIKLLQNAHFIALLSDAELFCAICHLLTFFGPLLN